MSVFFDVIAALLAYIYALWNNYAWAISGLTLVIMIVLTPLTLKGTRSMMVMQQLQPEMKKIQTRYKDDRQKLNEELLKFYKENDINPLGGCLPLLVQMPVFIVLYAVLARPDPTDQPHRLQLRLHRRPAGQGGEPGQPADAGHPRVWRALRDPGGHAGRLLRSLLPQAPDRPLPVAQPLDHDERPRHEPGRERQQGGGLGRVSRRART